MPFWEADDCFPLLLSFTRAEVDHWVVIILVIMSLIIWNSFEYLEQHLSMME